MGIDTLLLAPTVPYEVSIDDGEICGELQSSRVDECSPFRAVTIFTGAIITGCNLNVINDQDWFAWNVPSGAQLIIYHFEKTVYVG